jgi:hypothetical protein
MIEQEDTNLKMLVAGRDGWKTAEALALGLGKPRYTQIKYQNQKLTYSLPLNKGKP